MSTNKLNPPGRVHVGPIWRASFTFGHMTTDGQLVLPDDIERATTSLKVLLCQTCGGGSLGTAPGFFQHADGRVIDEVATTIWAYGRGQAVPIDAFLDAAARVAFWLKQEAVLLIVQGDVPSFFRFVPPATPEAEAAA